MPIRDRILAAVGAERGSAAANRICEVCVEEVDVDGAAISVMFDGASAATLGASSPQARLYDELQFTLGEGPCLDSVATGRPVLIDDLHNAANQAWTAYASAMLDQHMSSVFAVPVLARGEYIGALDLFRCRTGPLARGELAATMIAVDLAAAAILDILTQDQEAAANDPDSSAWAALNGLMRDDVNRATGTLVAQLHISPTEALVRLRAHAYIQGRSTTDVAKDILAGHLRITDDT